MASVQAYTVNQGFMLSITKELAQRPGFYWRNTYELSARGSGGLAELNTALDAFIAYEQDLHLPAVSFVKATVSTWTADSEPYNPNSFFERPLDIIGTRSAVSQSLPLDRVLWVEREALVGRKGKLFYRGCLTEADVDAPAGVAILADLAAMQAVLLAAVVNNGIDEYFPGGTAAFNLMLLRAEFGVQVTGLSVRGTIGVQLGKKYYDR